MRPKGTAAELEARRFRAAELLREGKSTAEVARLVGAGHSSVKKWKAALTRGGPEALAAKPPPPRISKLDDSQKAQLVEILLRGPLASGYRTDLWTCRRVADIVRKNFGVSYHPDHLGRIPVPSREGGHPIRVGVPLMFEEDGQIAFGHRNQTPFPRKIGRSTISSPFQMRHRATLLSSPSRVRGL
jgi:transposase